MRALETHYNGYRFRSRLEARWAVFFDACGIQYRYEPEGYDLAQTVCPSDHTESEAECVCRELERVAGKALWGSENYSCKFSVASSMLLMELHL
jgi:hypothetical protein